MKIILVGVYPPPYGGVSVHIKRLYEKLKKNISINILATNKNKNFKYKTLKKIIFKFPLLKKDCVYHFHNSAVKILSIIAFFNFIFRKKIIVTIHNNRLEENYKNSSKVFKFLLKNFIKYINHIILVSDYLKPFLIEREVKEQNISIIPAYINPVIKEEDYLKINEEVWDFIENSKRKNEKIITGNGNIKFFNNEDLYGLDLLIKLIYLLKKENYEVSLIFALLGYEGQTQKERNYFEILLKKIKEYQVEENIFIYKVKNTEYYPILDKSDIFIRPTNTDGDAVSLRESIYLKKPSIASETVKRPSGTILFKTRDIKDLLKKTKFVLDNYEEEKNKLEKIEVKEYYENVLEVYKKVYKYK